MARVYCGLDAGSSTCTVVAMRDDGTVVENRSFSTSEANLIEAFKRIPGELHVHVEASELAGWVRRILKPQVARVVVSHPAANKWIGGDSRKSDRRDAYKLADLLRRQAPLVEVFYPDDEHRAAFKTIVQHYDDLTDQESRIKFKIKAAFRQHGVLPTGETVYTPTGRLAYLQRLPSDAARTILGHLYQVLDQTLRTRDQARTQMLKESRRFPEVARMDGVPGVGPVGACQYAAYIQNPHRFSNKRKIWRYCRLAVTTRSSDGRSLGYAQLDRAGVGRLKAMTHAAFLGAMRRKDDNLFKRCYRGSVERTHNPVHARLTTQRKIVSVLRALWKGGVDYNDAKG